MHSILFGVLKRHFGHNVVIAAYGDPSDPTDVCLECEDCGCVVLDGELYDLCRMEDA